MGKMGNIVKENSLVLLKYYKVICVESLPLKSHFR